jgi:aspartyl-tRNA(Asn)/glutamyl-tRNA(Gln) amidotransferase subunit A
VASPDRPLRVGWLVEPGFGPIDSEVAATVQAAARALDGAGISVEAVEIPALAKDFALDVFARLHVNELKPAFEEATAGRAPDEIFTIARNMLAAPETPMDAFIEAEQAAERLRDGFADYFQRYDALLCPVLPIAAHEHSATELVINGQTVSAFNVMGATVPFNVTGLPALSMRFGTSHEGLPINVQLVSSWSAESTILQLASLLESLSPVRGLRPDL